MKTREFSLCYVFVTLLLQAVVVTPLLADTAIVNGITWTFTVTNGEAMIGDGMSVAISTSTPGEVAIPSTLGGFPVTSIGHNAFQDCSGLTRVEIPNSVTSIGSSAFRGCRGLTSVTIPDGVTRINSEVFYECHGLTSVTIPNSVTNIGGNAFRWCTGLTSVTIPDSVTSIGYEAFYACQSLQSLTLPDSVTSFGVNCFERCPAIYRAIFSGNAGGGSPVVVTSVVQQVEAPYSLSSTAADRAIASVTVSGDCSIDRFVLKDGKVYDSMMYVSNTADHEVTLSLPSGFAYKTVKGAKPLTIPALSQCIISITRVDAGVFLVLREELEDVK